MRLLDDNCDVTLLSNGSLSFIGDAVYSLLVRERLCCDANRQAGALHSLSAKIVNAPSQAKGFLEIEEILTEKELMIYKRGRNAHTKHTPKGCTEGEYHSATGVEALFGYLYLQGDTDRIKVLFDKIWSSLT